VVNRPSQERVHEIVSNAVAVECEFVSSALPVDLIGMNSGLMIEYIKFCADRLVKSMGYEGIFSARNPFDWMEMISIEGKTNFFEKRVSEYQLANVGVEGADAAFSTQEDF
jgi:ribonucleoside-diphosphate reductase beta chain